MFCMRDSISSTKSVSRPPRKLNRPEECKIEGTQEDHSSIECPFEVADYAALKNKEQKILSSSSPKDSSTSENKFFFQPPKTHSDKDDELHRTRKTEIKNIEGFISANKTSSALQQEQEETHIDIVHFYSSAPGAAPPTKKGSSATSQEPLSNQNLSWFSLGTRTYPQRRVTRPCRRPQSRAPLVSKKQTSNTVHVQEDKKLATTTNEEENLHVNVIVDLIPSKDARPDEGVPSPGRVERPFSHAKTLLDCREQDTVTGYNDVNQNTGILRLASSLGGTTAEILCYNKRVFDDLSKETDAHLLEARCRTKQEIVEEGVEKRLFSSGFGRKGGQEGGATQTRSPRAGQEDLKAMVQMQRLLLPWHERPREMQRCWGGGDRFKTVQGPELPPDYYKYSAAISSRRNRGPNFQNTMRHTPSFGIGERPGSAGPTRSSGQSSSRAFLSANGGVMYDVRREMGHGARVTHLRPPARPGSAGAGSAKRMPGPGTYTLPSAFDPPKGRFISPNLRPQSSYGKMQSGIVNGGMANGSGSSPRSEYPVLLTGTG